MLTRDQRLALKQTILAQPEIQSVWFNKTTGEWAFHPRQGYRLELTRQEALEDLAEVDVTEDIIGLSNDDALRAALEARGIPVPEELKPAAPEGYTQMRVSDLKDALDKRGIEYTSGDLKADLIQLLEADDLEKELNEQD